MEPRRVILTVEVLSDLPVVKLRAAEGLSFYWTDPRWTGDCNSVTEVLKIEQLQANVVAPSRQAKPAKRRRR
ncbi:MAG: hypothetical protein RL148_497 [Planctomycetota bacterium]|jgi:hypothetical protein